jgi:signal transduction histidine kinase
MGRHAASSLEQARSIGFAVLTILTVTVLIFNVTSDPTDSNQFCYLYANRVEAMLTIGLWILAIAASLGALSATYHQLLPAERYKQSLVWIIYLASVPALLLLPSSLSISGAIGTCATSAFFTYLSWYMIGVISTAALCCIHLLVHGVRYHQNQAEQSISNAAQTTAQHLASHKINNAELAGTIKQLRTPLTNLRVQIEALLESNTDKNTEQTQTTLLKINNSARTMSQTIETHLDLANLESGHMVINLIDLNFRDTVETICDELRPGILKKNLILLLRTNLTSQSIIHADRIKVHQILRILITQAEENTDRGTITAFVRDDMKVKKIYVDVIDTGRGMSSDQTAAVFMKDSKMQADTKTCSDNLKLCLVQKLAAAMGGTITAHSEGTGRGSRFTLVLPLEM